MRGPFVILLLALCAFSSCTAQSGASQFVPQNYRSADGALLLQTNGNYAEPYFAVKALITAQDAGLDIREAGLAWIGWALQRQDKDGLFGRYRQNHGEWKRTGPADADDSMLALWLQLLFRLAPDRGIPPQWQESVKKAQVQLAKLRNGRLGIYHVSGRNHVALFMDNMEVYAALKDMALAQARFGDQRSSESTNKQAGDLAAAIDHVFWDKNHKWFRSSIQKVQPAFYPDVVAQVYPLLADFPLKNENARAAWSKWRSSFASAWLKDLYDPHPWGLVALAAMKMGDKSSALCWLTRSESLRYSPRWNILEEAVFQGLEQQLQAYRHTSGVACSKTADQEPATPGAL